MSDVLLEVTTHYLQAFADAWNQHDAAASAPRKVGAVIQSPGEFFI